MSIKGKNFESESTKFLEDNEAYYVGVQSTNAVVLDLNKSSTDEKKHGVSPFFGSLGPGKGFKLNRFK